MTDFLTFKSFISTDILIFCYYIGAIVIPIFLWKSRNYLIDKFNISTPSSLNNQNRNYIKVAVIVIFICMEIFWRMIFELMIAYFQMRDYLQLIAQ